MDFKEEFKKDAEQIGQQDQIKRSKSMVQLKNEEFYKENNIQLNAVADLQKNKKQIDNKQADNNGLGEAVAEEGYKNAEKPAPAEPQYVGFGRKYMVIKDTDGKRMKKVREALKNYYYVVDERKGDNKSIFTEESALDGIIKACKEYGKFRFACFKDEYGRQRLKEVKGLMEEARAKKELAKLEEKRRGYIVEKNDNEKWDIFRIHALGDINGFTYWSVGVLSVISMVAVNLVRLATWPIAAPLWALNEGVRAVEEKMGRTPHRHLRFPGLHGNVYYAVEICRLFRGNFSMPGQGPRLIDRFFTDYKTDKHIVEAGRQDQMLAEDEEYENGFLSGGYRSEEMKDKKVHEKYQEEIKKGYKKSSWYHEYEIEDELEDEENEEDEKNMTVVNDEGEEIKN